MKQLQMNTDYFELNSGACFYVNTLTPVIAGQSDEPVSVPPDFGHDMSLVERD